MVVQRFADNISNCMSYKLIFLLIGILPVLATAEQVHLKAAADAVDVTVVESNDLRTVVTYEVNSFSKEPVGIDNQEFFRIYVTGESILLNETEPELPRICRSIIIPDNAGMKIKVISAEYTDFPNTPIVPSKGNLLRTVNPEDVPYNFGPVYALDEWYPADLARIREPYILRHYRGTVIELNAFQYHPATRTLRVYTSVTVEVVNAGPGKINTIPRDKRAGAVIPDFETIYGRHFINYPLLYDKYAPVAERGDMLVITYDAYQPLIEPFVEWKRQKGIRTWVVPISAIGNDGSLIASYIKQFYEADSTNLAFVLLVGDNAHIKRPSGSGKSDPVYAKVAGSDDYPDILIGRFSADSAADVETQVERTLVYEMNPQSGDWFHMGTGIGSDDPTVGQDGEYDWQHEDLIRDDLLNFTYTEIDRLYEHLGASVSDVSAALNEGRSIVNYTGHGTATNWTTTGFNNYNVNNLINDNKLPFIISVACNNGQFDIYTCFAEAWLRANNSGVPTGAVAFYGSLISQSWTPPMDCQDEVVDLLCASQLGTFGGLCFNGACKMIDLNEDYGAIEFNAWTIFGDPSIAVRTDNPVPMTVEHDDVIEFVAGEYEVGTDTIEGALCALYADGILYGSAYTDAAGNASIPLSDTLPLGKDINLTVTAFNRVPYLAVIPAVAPTTPHLMYAGSTADDAGGGNGNGLIECGETVVLGMEIKNIGLAMAHDVSAEIITADTLLTIIKNDEWFGDIDGNYNSIYIADAYSFEVDPRTPDGHVVPFDMRITDGGTQLWLDSFSLTMHAPILEVAAFIVTDASGNGNRILDPGETADLVITIKNSGSGRADDVIAYLSTDDPYLSIIDDAGAFGTVLESGGSADNEFDAFTIKAEAACSRGYEVLLRLDLAEARGHTATIYFSLVVGDRVIIYTDDFSYDRGWRGLGDPGEWTIGPASGGTGSDGYGLADPSMDNTPTADNYVLGNDLTPLSGGDYNPNLSATYWVTSPPIDCSEYGGITLSFYRLLGIDSNIRDFAYLQVYDGSDWATIYANEDAFDDPDWTEVKYDVSSAADSNDSFQFRFGIGPTNGWGNYRGWNIDDLKLEGFGEWYSAQIGFDVLEISDSLIPDETAADTIVIYNYSPDMALEVRFSPDVPWIGCLEEPQIIDPGGFAEFVVNVAPDEMGPGNYTGHLTYSCNDYVYPYGEIAIQLHLYAPDLDIPVLSVEASVDGHGEASQELIIYNNGPGRLFYETECLFNNGGVPPARVADEYSVLGTRAADAGKSDGIESYFKVPDRSSGGPDNYGYVWIDSDDPGGPVYSWIDISAVGMPLSLPDDGFMGPLYLASDFSFYGNTYDQVYVGSNGFLTFGSGNSDRNNVGIPDTTNPDNLIAMWWDDLDPPEGGRIYFFYDNPGQRFIISFENIQNYSTAGGTGSLTFQAVLNADGSILLQYAGMDPGTDPDGLTGATIGLENADGSDGLEVIYNSEYMHDHLAILLKAVRWMSVSPSAGIIEPFSSDILSVNFDAGDLAPGDFTAELVIHSNDPETPSWVIPVSLTVGEVMCGDANGDGDVNVADVVALVSYIFKGGMAPDPISAGDANGDGDVDMADAVYMINRIFKGGPAPVC